MLVGGLTFVGCGGSADNGDAGNDSGLNDSANGDGGVTDAAVTYPADHTPLPQVDYNGGRILANPKIVTITFAGDDSALVARLQQFGDIITTTPWWTATTSEYCDTSKACIGMGSSGGHVVVQDPAAATYDDSSQGAASSLQDFIKLHVGTGIASDAGTDAGDGGFVPDFPPADPNTLYVIYFPAGVTINLDGSPSCQSFGAYHNTTIVPDMNGTPSTVAYAVIPRCDTKETTATLSASHEIGEAATDPDIGVGSLSYYMTSAPLWTVSGGEIGDLCEGFGSNGVSYVESTFTVQRLWSNKSAAASHDPCVPIPTGSVYFNAAPRQSKVVLPKIGASGVVDIDVFSDAPYPPWTLSAVDFAAFQQGSPVLSFSFDNTSVQNGDHVQLTVTCVGPMPSNGQDEFAIESKDSAGHRHSWPVLAAIK